MGNLVYESHRHYLISVTQNQPTLDRTIESTTELEAYTQNQFIAVREELKKALIVGAASPTENRVTPDAIAKTVQVEMNLPSAKLSPADEPDWVTADYRRFYKKLVADSELLAKVIEAISQHPKDNSALAESLVMVGLHKQDGTALDSASTSHIRTVASRLNESGGSIE